MIRFGPAGIGGVKEAPERLEMYFSNGIKAAEIPFTYQVFIKKDDAIRIGKIAKRFGIKLSIHAPYFVNLNSAEKEKIEKSKQRILRCCRIGHYLNAKRIVFHCGYYGKMGKEETFQNIKREILEMKKEIKKNRWNVKLCPEIMGKKNVFGSIDEISRLAKETKCGFCIDFAHVLARYGDYNLKEIKKNFPQKSWHCHFSGIEYNEKGERRHKQTSEKEMKKLIPKLPKGKEIVIINESPHPLKDSLLCLKYA